MKIDLLIEKEVQETESYELELSESKFLELLRENCKNSYTIIKKSPLYTFEGDYPTSIIKPAVKEKKTSFWVDKLASKYASWKRYPPRTKSLKLFQDLRRVGDDAHVVIPFDGARLGICSGSTFYRSFEHAAKKLAITKVDNYGLESWITTVAEAINGILKDEIKIWQDLERFSEFEKALNSVEKVLKSKLTELKTGLKNPDSALDDEQKKILSDLLERRIIDVDQYLDEVLDPETNQFHNIKIESYSGAAHDHEVWTDAQCLVIKRSKYVELFKRGEVK